VGLIGVDIIKTENMAVENVFNYNELKQQYDGE